MPKTFFLRTKIITLYEKSINHRKKTAINNATKKLRNISGTVFKSSH